MTQAARDVFDKVQAEIKRRGDLGIFAYGIIPTTCFTQKLECGKCHSVYHHDSREERANGNKPVQWICYGSYPGRKSRKAICNVGRFLWENELIAKCNAVLGMKEFDEAIFLKRIEKIIVLPEKLTFRLTDGKEIDAPIYVKEDSKTRKPPTQFSQWTGKIRCEVCGKNYVRQTRHYLNGDTEHYWICGTGKTCEGRKNGILWQNDIDEGAGNATDDVEFITAGLGRTLTVHFKDGTEENIPWNKRKKHFSPKKGR